MAKINVTDTHTSKLISIESTTVSHVVDRGDYRLITLASRRGFEFIQAAETIAVLAKSLLLIHLTDNYT